MSHPISERILILDDDNEMRHMLGLLLTAEGYQITPATNGLEAISLHRQSPFDVAIIELAMAGNDGFEALIDLRRTESPPKFIAIARTSWTPAEVYLKMAKQLGAHETLSKPFTGNQLL